MSDADKTSQPQPQGQKEKQEDRGLTKLPNGVVLDKDGKPCRLCTSAASWRALTKQAKSTPSSTSSTSSTTRSDQTPTQSSTPPTDCPPDTEELGRSTWTFLHSLTAAYPTSASAEQQREMGSFLGLFSRLYPCWVCAEDFQAWMAEERNRPRLGGRREFGNWMCEAHNEVNRKLGKGEFD
ncbi:sulfhydryl oxidase, partial [Aspergillus sp. HF37]